MEQFVPQVKNKMFYFFGVGEAPGTQRIQSIEISVIC